MEQRQAINRSTLFTRRMHSTEEAGGGGGTGRLGSSRYDRNRFTKLDLGSSSDASSTPDSGRVSLYEGGGGRPGLGLYEGVRLGLYDGGGRRGSVQKDGDGGVGGGGGRTPLLLYESLRDRARDTGGGGGGGRVRSILDDDILTSDPPRNNSLSNGVHEFEFQDTGARDQGVDREEEGGGRYGTTDPGGRFQPSDIDRLLESVRRGEGASWRNYRKPAELEDVIYYRLIDNYMIYQLEAVDPGSSTTGVSSPAHPDATSSSSVLQKLLEGLRLPSEGIPVDKKLGIIKNLNVLIEELQQKATKLQAEVEDADTTASIENSKLNGSQSLGVSTCNATSCRHLEELESIRKQKASLLTEKCQLEDQIVQLRSVKNVVHDTDSEKRAAKLELENRKLQNQLDTLRQSHDLLPTSPDDQSDIKQQLPQTQQTTSANSEMEERINERVQRLKEMHNLTSINRKTNDGKDPAVGKTSSSSSSSANQPEMSAGKTGLSRLQQTSSEARRLADDVKQTKQDCAALQKWLTGQVQTISSQLALLARQLDNTNNKCNSVTKNRSNNEVKRKNKNFSTSSSSSSTPEKLRPLLLATTSLSSLDYGDDGKFERLSLASSAAAAGESNRMMIGSSYDLHRDLGIINREGDLAMNGERIIRSLKADVKDGIRVVCRIRPVLKGEDGKKGSSCMLPPSDSRTIQTMHRGRMKTFEVDAIFNSVDSQQKIFEELKGPLNSCFDGCHVNFIAYGETGSGKSFTIQGTKEVPGFIHLVTEHLLKKTRDLSQPIDWNLTMSITEIHNESIRDLLNSDPNAKLETKPNPDGSINTCGLVQVAVESEAKISEILKRSQEMRSIGSNRSIDHSARSHLIVTVTATGVNKDNGAKIIGRVNLVDLAGSERIEKSSLPANDPFRFKEVQSVSKSLACLGDVLYAILSKQTHLPFRSSRLTHFLQESLGGRDSSTVLICQLVDSEKRASETISTLMFAQRVRTLELPSPATGGAGAGGSGGGSKGQGDGSSGSRTPVEPVNQRPRRPSAPSLAERMAIFSAAAEEASSGDKRPGPGAKRPPVPLFVNAGTKGASSAPRDGSESRNENRPPTPGSRPKSSLKVLLSQPPPPAAATTTTTTTTTTPRR